MNKINETDPLFIKNLLKQKECGYISDILKKYNAILSGSLLLYSYSDKYNELDSKINRTLELFYEDSLEKYTYIKQPPADSFDIYLHKEDLIEILNELIVKYGFGISNIKIHYPYQENYEETFLLTHDAVVRVMLYNPNTNINIDIIVIKSTKELVSAVKEFDLTFCRLWYDGDKVYSYDLEEIKEMKGSLKPNYHEYYCNDNLFMLNRLQKYRCRGFNIALPKCRDIKSKESNIETFIIKDILNKLLLSIEQQKSNNIKDFFISMFYRLEKSIITDNMLENEYIIPMITCYFLSNFNHFNFNELNNLIPKDYKKKWIALLKTYRDDKMIVYKNMGMAIKEQEHNTDNSSKEVLKKMITKQERQKKIIQTINNYIKKQSTIKNRLMTHFTLKKGTKF